MSEPGKAFESHVICLKANFFLKGKMLGKMVSVLVSMSKAWVTALTGGGGRGVLWQDITSPCHSQLYEMSTNQFNAGAGGNPVMDQHPIPGYKEV